MAEISAQLMRTGSFCDLAQAHSHASEQPFKAYGCWFLPSVLDRYTLPSISLLPQSNTECSFGKSRSDNNTQAKGSCNLSDRFYTLLSTISKELEQLLGVFQGSAMTDLSMFAHKDVLGALNERNAITEKVDYLHGITKERYPFVDRLAIAVYDSKCDLLKTFAHSTDSGNPLPKYQAKLSEASSLKKILAERKPRIVNDLTVFDKSENRHARRIKEHGYLSSYTIPLFQGDDLLGFVFYNSLQKDVFSDDKLAYLDMIAHLISLLVGGEVKEIKTLHGALQTATEFTSHRDPETGAHLERMARFVRIIARDVAEEEGFDDEQIERLYWYAPLHDVGKITVPDNILLKEGPLSDEEFEVMKTHADRGGEIIQRMLENFKLEKGHYIPQLINIAKYHHENIDGSGYPDGLKGEMIPVEARIVAVADVFDALTSERPYKKAWSNDEAFDELRSLTKWKLDSRFVAALERNIHDVVQVQQQFQDEPLN